MIANNVLAKLTSNCTRNLSITEIAQDWHAASAPDNDDCEENCSESGESWQYHAKRLVRQTKSPAERAQELGERDGIMYAYQMSVAAAAEAMATVRAQYGGLSSQSDYEERIEYPPQPRESFRKHGLPGQRFHEYQEAHYRGQRKGNDSMDYEAQESVERRLALGEF